MTLRSQSIELLDPILVEVSILPRGASQSPLTAVIPRPRQVAVWPFAILLDRAGISAFDDLERFAPIDIDHFGKCTISRAAARLGGTEDRDAAVVRGVARKPGGPFTHPARG